MWTALRYVECNPVRAGMAEQAQDYRWLAAHCGLRPDALIKPDSPWQKQLAAVADWPGWLAQADNENANMLRLHANNKGLPCGDEGFITKLSGRAGCSLTPKPQVAQKSATEKRVASALLSQKGTLPFLQLTLDKDRVAPTIGVTF